jgi:head-tail adaptor
MSTVVAGKRIHLVSLANATTAPDGQGGYTETLTPLTPATLYADIRPATARDLERMAAGTVLSMETLIVVVPFHPSVTTKTQLTWLDRAGRSHLANVTGVNNPDQRCIDLILVAVEVVA